MWASACACWDWGLVLGLPLAVGVGAAPAKEDVFPGRKGKIAVVLTRVVGDEYQGYVATLNADGSRFRVLHPRTQLSSPRWSPDGKRLVVSRGTAGEIPTSIQIMNADGSRLRPVFGRAIQNRTELSVGSPDWLPGGKSIAFLGHKGSRTGIYTIKPDGTSMRKVVLLPDLPLERGGPTLFALRASPDGRRFAFARETPQRGGFEVYVVKSNGSGLTRVARGCSDHGASLDWSPNGKRLLGAWTDLDRLSCAETSGIFIVSPAGGTPRRIFTERYERRGPGDSVGGRAPVAAFSADGKQVVFAVNRRSFNSSLRETLMVMSANGGTPQVVLVAGELAGFAPSSWQSLRR